MSDRLTNPLINEAMKQAIDTGRPRRGDLLHHNDRGCQYTSVAFQEILRGLGIVCSMSRPGCCYDNVVAERLFLSLKHEWTNHETFRELEASHWSVFHYIAAFSKSVRIHLTLDYERPNQYEDRYAQQTACIEKQVSANLVLKHPLVVSNYDVLRTVAHESC